MSIEPHIPPQLQQFIRDQIDAGRFDSESEVIQTALRLLEEQFHSRESFHEWLKMELDKGLDSRPGEPATKEYWNRLRDRVNADLASRHGA